MTLFSVIYDINTSTELNNDLQKISDWAYKWKMFSRKTTKLLHPNVFFNDVPITSSSSQKQPKMYLEEKLNFNHHIKEKKTTAKKGIIQIKNFVISSSKFSSNNLQSICKTPL